jgi:hypothetical protein
VSIGWMEAYKRGGASVGEGLLVVTSGNVTDEMWADYIKNQTPPEPDDNFNVT